MIPDTFITEENRNGRPFRAIGYVCRHRMRMSECPREQYGRQVEEHMVRWWNESFSQMQDRIVIRDQILRS